MEPSCNAAICRLPSLQMARAQLWRNGFEKSSNRNSVPNMKRGCNGSERRVKRCERLTRDRKPRRNCSMNWQAGQCSKSFFAKLLSRKGGEEPRNGKGLSRWSGPGRSGVVDAESRATSRVSRCCAARRSREPRHYGTYFHPRECCGCWQTLRQKTSDPGRDQRASCELRRFA